MKEPSCDLKDLIDNNEGLILLTGNSANFFGKLFYKNKLKDFNQILKGLKLVSDYLDKSILQPNNMPHPKSRIEFLNSIKE